jgi:hypothetical protein
MRPSVFVDKSRTQTSFDTCHAKQRLDDVWVDDQSSFEKVACYRHVFMGRSLVNPGHPLAHNSSAFGLRTLAGDVSHVYFHFMAKTLLEDDAGQPFPDADATVGLTRCELSTRRDPSSFHMRPPRPVISRPARTRKSKRFCRKLATLL